MELEIILARELGNRGFKIKESWEFINSLTDLANDRNKMSNVANAIISAIAIHKDNE